MRTSPHPDASSLPAAVPPVLSLVIPCFDEADNLPLLIKRIDSSFADEREVEVILVDNGSTDESPAILSRLAGHPIIRSVRVPVNKGYGYGILAGLRAARGGFLGWTHADMQTDPADALLALALIRDSATDRLYVKGRRYGRPLADLVFTVGMSVFESALLRAPLWDINAQPNFLPRAFFEEVADLAPPDFSLDLYFYHAAVQRGLEVRRFPVQFGPRAHGSSHWNVDFAAKARFIRNTVKFSLELRKRSAGSSAP